MTVRWWEKVGTHIDTERTCKLHMESYQTHNHLGVRQQCYQMLHLVTSLPVNHWWPVSH